MRNFESEIEAEEPEDGADQGIIDSFEENLYDLSGMDAQIAVKIAEKATQNFTSNPGAWTLLLEETSELINEFRKGDHDEDEFTARLQAKLDEAVNLSPQ